MIDFKHEYGIEIDEGDDDGVVFACDVLLSRNNNGDEGYLIDVERNGIRDQYTLALNANNIELKGLYEWLKRFVIDMEQREQYKKHREWVYCHMIDRISTRIESDIEFRLYAGLSEATHHYIAFENDVRNSKTLTSPLSIMMRNGRIVLGLYKDNRLVSNLNAQETLEWLTNHPETPIYQAYYATSFEQVVFQNLERKNKIHYMEHLYFMTGADRFKWLLENQPIQVKGKKTKMAYEGDGVWNVGYYCAYEECKGYGCRCGFPLSV